MKLNLSHALTHGCPSFEQPSPRPRRSPLASLRLAIVCLLTAIALLASPPAVSAAGTWSALANQAPGGVALMILLPDGTVMGQNGSAWYKLTPDSNGHYLNGTWTTLASMHDTRTYYQSQVLTDGRLFVSGGEYGSGGTNCETYDPASNTWTQQPQPGLNLIDSEAVTLPNGNVMVASLSTGQPCLVYDIVANTWSDGATSLDGQDEAAWVKLSDGSTLTIDPFGTNTERYIPSLNRWVGDNPVPVTMYGYGGELGAGFLLPNGNVFYIGATNHTAIYTPTGTTNAGTWTAGATIPNNLGAVDSSAAMLNNGKVLCALGTDTNFGSTTYFYEYNYVSNSFTQAGSPTGGTSAAIIPYGTQMLDLPDGTVLFSYGNAQVYSYQPDGAPVTNGVPTIANVIVNNDGSYAIFGKLLNGISQGAAYGDDKQMDTGRPIAYITNSAGHVQFCRTYNWSTCNVATGTNVLSTFLAPPAGLAAGTYSLVVAANGIKSAPHSFTVGSVTHPAAPTGLAASGGVGGVNLTWVQSTNTGIAYNRIYRSISGSGGPYNLLATVPATTGYADSSVTGENTYYYEVSAINGTAESALSTAAGAAAQFAPTGFWKFDDGSGTVATDSSGNGYHGTVSGTGAAWVTGFSGEALQFNGASNWVAFGTGPSVSGQNDFTLAAWIKTTATAQGVIIQQRDAGYNGEYQFSVNASGTLQFYAYGSIGYQFNLATTQTVNDGGWHYVTAVRSGLTGSIYIDGTLAISTNGTAVASMDSTIGTYVARDVRDNTLNFNGVIDEVRLYNTAGLSATDVQNLYRSYFSPPPAPTGLTATGSNAAVYLTWTQSTGTNLTQNKVYRSTTGSGGTYNLLATLSPTTSYADTAVVNGSTYYYSVTAVNVIGESALSAYAGATPRLPLPAATGNWHFNDGSGTVATDSSGQGYNGTLSGSGATWVTGRAGTGIQFNGASNWVTFGTGPSVSGTNSFTVAAWIKTSATTQGTIMQQRDAAGFNGEYQLSVNTNGTVQFYLYGNSAYQFNFATTQTVNNGAWHHVVAVRRGLTGSIYIDGTLAASATGTAVATMASTISTAVGRDIRNNNLNFNGVIDEVQEYATYGFTAADVQTLYTSY